MKKLLISAEWLRKQTEDDDPFGCSYCGAIAGCCPDYPDCMGGEEAKLFVKKDISEDI